MICFKIQLNNLLIKSKLYFSKKKNEKAFYSPTNTIGFINDVL
jgi:hypothetical protein